MTSVRKLSLVVTLLVLGAAAAGLMAQGPFQPSGPAVTISGPLPLPVTVDNGGNGDPGEPGRHPYQVRFVTDAATEFKAVLPMVPAGKRVVLQSFSAITVAGNSSIVTLRIEG